MDLNQVWASLPAQVAGDLETDWCRSLDYSIYQALGAVLMPGSILEIRARVGHSLIALAAENPRLRKIRWIDNESYVQCSNALASANLADFFRRTRPDWPQPEMEYTTIYLPATELRGKYDLCHIDGDHSYAGKLGDLDYCRRLDPLWIIADDVDYHPQDEGSDSFMQLISLKFAYGISRLGRNLHPAREAAFVSKCQDFLFDIMQERLRTGFQSAPL